MKYLHHYISVLVTLFVCFEQSIALKCYECNSATDKRCLGDENNKLSDDLKITCLDKSPHGDHPYVLCRKIKQVIDFEVNGLKPDSRIIRTCGWDTSSYQNRCYHRSGFGGRQEVCACEGDGCNGSSTIYSSATLLGSLLIFLRIYL
ncbi:uncharacterized protein LOC123316788 [Coccinella septempunctata]|uniref:uncharacterized protein LOC123316788 n=1 Tax=Coccinella septempunctata TaxID=41139 RepID=UPI001D0720CC|nr:uncharacterized protein LOC123316788 [Coccinella septempunctata]